MEQAEPSSSFKDSPLFDRTEKDRDRTGQGRMRTGKAGFLGFSPCDILIGRTRISALPVCLISQYTFGWLIFSP